jgi:hypothetical protein
MTFTILEPEVAGGWGPRTVADRSVHPPRVERLHYEFAGWLGDDLLESFPCYVVTPSLAEALGAAQCTGFSLDDVLVTSTEEFRELYPGRKLPAFRWLKVHGVAGTDDFGHASDFRLVVSSRALAVLDEFQLQHAERDVYVSGT